ncbi:MAG: benzoate-CoA ligase family protein, partial [Pseudomonadota bacterium]
QFYLQDSSARIALADAAFASTFNATAVAETSLESVIVIGEAASTAVETKSEQDFLDGASTTLAAAPTRPDDMAFWLYSSGTTGRPKGIVHLHHDLAYTAASYANHILKLTVHDICYSVPKIFFAYGLGNTLTFPFSAGASCVLIPGQPRPDTVLAAIQKHKPTVFFGLPTLYTALARAPDAAASDFASIRLSISAAETLSKAVFEQWRDLTGQEVVEGLGSTELLHIYLSNRPDRKKLGAAGMRVPGYEVELRDSDGNVLDNNEEGVLWARGHSSAPLYWNRPDKTSETMQGDWINTGDRFTRDTDGFYFFKGRADDLIKVSGQWVHPLEVERCLQTHESVAECAVFAHKLDDERMTLRAFVSLKAGLPSNPQATSASLQDFVKRTLLPYKYPRIIEYLDDLPKTGTGKLDRHALKERPVAAAGGDA